MFKLFPGRTPAIAGELAESSSDTKIDSGVVPIRFGKKVHHREMGVAMRLNVTETPIVFVPIPFWVIDNDGKNDGRSLPWSYLGQTEV